MNKGLTLIELLVVISIIGILASVGAFSYEASLKNARDARRKSAVQDLSKAIMSYYYATGNMPANIINGLGYCTNHTDFLKVLFDGGYIKQALPADSTFCYYNYGAGAIGALVMTYLEGIDDTTDTTRSMAETCRPFANNWCSNTLPSKHYCICNTY